MPTRNVFINHQRKREREREMKIKYLKENRCSILISRSIMTVSSAFTGCSVILALLLKLVLRNWIFMYVIVKKFSERSMELKLSALSIYDRPTSRQTDNGLIRKLPYNYLENPIDDNTARKFFWIARQKNFCCCINLQISWSEWQQKKRRLLIGPRQENPGTRQACYSLAQIILGLGDYWAGIY